MTRSRTIKERVTELKFHSSLLAVRQFISRQKGSSAATIHSHFSVGGSCGVL
jgi:hypothetical protein